MNLKRTSQVTALFTQNGYSDHIRVAAGSTFQVGQTVCICDWLERSLCGALHRQVSR